MNAVPFDTLKLARRLEAAGLAATVAAGTAEALADAMSGAELATKTDLALIRTELGVMEAGLKREIGASRAEVKGDIELLRRDMEVLRRELTIKLGSMMIIAVGVILTAIRYLPPHP